MNRKQKKIRLRIIISGLLFALGLLLPFEGPIRLAVFLVPYAVISWDVLYKAVRNISHGQVFDENFLMAIATIGAFATREYPEGVAVMLFYQVGELFQSYAVGKSRKSIAALMDIRPDYANIEENGRLVQVDPDDVAIGQTIVVKPGERIPLDGVVLEGYSTVNTAALTGEPVPRDILPGDTVISGCVNINGLLYIRTTKVFGESTVAKILDMVENAVAKKARTENFITKFAKYYTPAVVISAALLAVMPPLILGGGWNNWIHRALIFLVISCPCALVISVPLGFFGGIGGASKSGILVKGSNYLEALAQTEIVVFDKTGTLTRGTFRVTALEPQAGFEDTLLELACLANGYSDHPIAQSLHQAYGKALDTTRVQNAQTLPGRGVSAEVAGKTVLAGNSKLMEEAGIDFSPASQAGTIIHVAQDGRYAGHIVISDELKPDAASAIAALRAGGIRTVMLTGDSKAAGEQVARELGIDQVHTELLPGDKVDQVEALLNQTSSSGKLAFVGDGINDAPVLSRADIGIAMGGLGSDAAIEAADIVLMDDAPSKLTDAMAISRKTLRIVKQNIVFALGVKGIVLLLGAFGMANMWEAVFADVGVSVIAILNAMRALQTPQE